MENLHSYLFPAVGSLKEKRMCFAEAPNHQPVVEEVNKVKKEVDDLNDDAGVDKATEIHGKIVAAEKQMKDLKKLAADTNDTKIEQIILDHMKPVKVTIDAMHAAVEQKLLKIIPKEAEKKKKEISDKVAEGRPTLTAEICRKWLVDLAKDLDKSNISIAAARVSGLEGFLKANDPSIKLDLAPDPLKAQADASKGKYKEWVDARETHAKAAKDGVPVAPGTPEPSAALEAYRTSLRDWRTAGVDHAKTHATTTYKEAGADVSKHLTDAEAPGKSNIINSVQHLKAAMQSIKDADAALKAVEGTKPTPATTTPAAPDTEKEKQAKEAMKTEIDAVVKSKGAKADLDKLNTKIGGDLGKAQAAASAIEAELPTYKVAVLVGKDGKHSVIMENNAGANIDKLDEALTLKKIVELILKFLADAGVIKSLENTKDVSTKVIDDKIADLTAKREKVAKDPDPKAKDELAKIDAEINALKLARPVVVEAGKLGLTVNVDKDGKLKLAGDKNKIRKIKEGISKLPISFDETATSLDFDKLKQGDIKMLLDLLKKLVPIIGGPNGPQYYPPYAPPGYNAGAYAGPDGAFAYTGPGMAYKPGMSFEGAGKGRASA